MFKSGQKVVCKVDDFTACRADTGEIVQDLTPSPKKGEISTVDKATVIFGKNVISLKEYHPNDFFLANQFEPAVDDSCTTVEELIKTLPFHEYQTVEVQQLEP